MYQNCVDYQFFEDFYDTSQIKKPINILLKEVMMPTLRYCVK